MANTSRDIESCWAFLRNGLELSFLSQPPFHRVALRGNVFQETASESEIAWGHGVSLEKLAEPLEGICPDLPP